MRIAVLASGSGSNLKTILALAKDGRLDARVVLVLSNNPDAGALEHAKAHNVPVWCKSHKSANREAFDAEMAEAIKKSGAEAVILAGYMRILSKEFIQAFSGRILNIHPAILPSFAGAHGGRDAIDYQVRVSGCTVHFVDEIMDNGPVVIQAAVPLVSGDSQPGLMTRIQAMEHRIYPQAIQWLAQGRLKTAGRKVELLPKPGIALRPASIGENANGPWMASPALEDF